MSLSSLIFGSEETKQELPKWYEDAAQANISRAQDISEMGYMPYYGVDVAGFTPMQQSAMQNTNRMAQQYGMNVADQPSPYNMVTDPTTGIQGFRSGDVFDQARNELKQRAPAQYDYYNSMVIDPVTGEYGSRTRGGEVLGLLEQIGVDTSGINAGSSGSAGGDGDSAIQSADISKMSADTIMKLRALSNNPLMKMGPLPGLLALLAGKYADYYGGDYGKEGQPGMYSGDDFYRDSNGLISPVRGEEYYGSSEAKSNQDRANSAKAAIDQARTTITTSDGGSDPTYSSGRGSLGVGGGNASRGYVTGGW